MVFLENQQIYKHELYDPIVNYHLMLDKISFKLGISMSILISTGFFLSYTSNSLIPKAYGHLDHFPHYNGGGDGVGQYYAYIGLDPEYTRPYEITQITFSIQDFNGNDVYNVETMVEIYETLTGERIAVYPWTLHNIGDFNINYVFPKIGNYQIVLSVANSNDSIINYNEIDPPRSILGNTQNCNCDRAVFNISVSSNFGSIYSTTLLMAVAGPIIVLGVVLGLSYRNRRKRGIYSKLSEKEMLKYSVMFLAIAAGLVHLAIFSEHGSRHVYYSIFLLAAGGAQIAYGISYVLITLTNESIYYKNKESIMTYYRKTIIINLFGLLGTGVLLGLYTYSVIFPPPLSPTNEPEEIDLAGILDKSLEIFLFGGIIYLMKWERQRSQNQLVSIK
jgi:hypothetical protein